MNPTTLNPTTAQPTAGGTAAPSTQLPTGLPTTTAIPTTGTPTTTTTPVPTAINNNNSSNGTTNLTDVTDVLDLVSNILVITLKDGVNGEMTEYSDEDLQVIASISDPNDFLLNGNGGFDCAALDGVHVLIPNEFFDNLTSNYSYIINHLPTCVISMVKHNYNETKDLNMDGINDDFILTINVLNIDDNYNPIDVNPNVTTDNMYNSHNVYGLRCVQNVFF